MVKASATSEECRGMPIMKPKSDDLFLLSYYLLLS